MKPLQRIREQPDEVRATCAARGLDAPIDRIIDLDAQVRALRQEEDKLKAERNRESRGGPPTEAVKARMREVGDRIKDIETRREVLEAELEEKVLSVEIDDPVDRRVQAPRR